MKPLEDKIKEAVQKDGLTGLTCFSAGKDNWQCNAQFKGEGWRPVTSPCIVTAMHAVLGGASGVQVLPDDKGVPEEDIFG